MVGINETISELIVRSGLTLADSAFGKPAAFSTILSEEAPDSSFTEVAYLLSRMHKLTW
jgi:hypothetical protein